MKDRIRKIIEREGMTRDELSRISDIPYTTWSNILRGKQRVNEDHIRAITALFPQYAYWLVTGETLPEAGQISPDSDTIRKQA